MKKTFAFILLIILQSCSNDDSSTNNKAINPPQWLLGTWLEEVDEEPINNGARFTNNNVFLISSNGEISIKEISDPDSIIEDTIANDTYKIVISSNFLPELESHHFILIDENTIRYERRNLNTVLKKQ